MSLYTTTRDLAQRSLGCLGFSMIAHVTVLGALILMPRDRIEAPAFASTSAASTVELAGGAARGAPHETTHEVLLANEDDLNAVALPPTKTAKTAKTPKAEAKKIAKAATPVLVQKESDIVVKVPDAKTEPDEKPTEEFQPSAVADTEEKSQDVPEQLSPVITEEPVAEEPIAPAEEPQEVPRAAEKPLAAAPAAMQMAKPNMPSALQSKPASQALGQPNGLAKQGQAPTGMVVAGGSAVNGTPTGTSGYGGGSGQIVDASLRKPISGPLPHYPQQDRLLRREGLAVVVARVHANGSVDGVYVERSSGSRDMDQAAVESFKSWRFVPGPEASVRKSFQFSLRGEAQIGYAKLKQ